MGTLIILSGIPGSGKSTWAQRYKNEKSAMIVSRDKIRFKLLKPSESYFSHEKETKQQFYTQIRQGLACGKTVIADATHLNFKSRYELLTKVNDLQPDVIVVQVRTPIKECLRRNALRSGRELVPDASILEMAAALTDPKTDRFKYKEIIYVDYV